MTIVAEKAPSYVFCVYGSFVVPDLPAATTTGKGLPNFRAACFFEVKIRDENQNDDDYYFHILAVVGVMLQQAVSRPNAPSSATHRSMTRRGKLGTPLPRVRTPEVCGGTSPGPRSTPGKLVEGIHPETGRE